MRQCRNFHHQGPRPISEAGGHPPIYTLICEEPVFEIRNDHRIIYATTYRFRVHDTKFLISPKHQNLWKTLETKGVFVSFPNLSPHSAEDRATPRGGSPMEPVSLMI